MPQEEWTKYQRILDFLRLRKRAYQLTFQNRKNNEVLKDLARFCKITKSPAHTDSFRLGVYVGRQEVFRRIADHLNLQPEELYELYNSPSTIQPRKE